MDAGVAVDMRWVVLGPNHRRLLRTPMAGLSAAAATSPEDADDEVVTVEAGGEEVPLPFGWLDMVGNLDRVAQGHLRPVNRDGAS